MLSVVTQVASQEAKRWKRTPEELLGPSYEGFMKASSANREVPIAAALLARACRNAIRDFLRWERRWGPQEAEESFLELVEAPCECGTQEDFLAFLLPHAGNIVKLLWLEGLTPEEVALREGCSTRWVRKVREDAVACLGEAV